MATFGLRGAAVAVLLGLSMPLPAEPLRIDGLSPPPVAGAAAEVLVPHFELHAKAGLQFRLDEQQVSISPWPAQLPRHLGAQYVAAWVVMHPAGPMRIMTFRTAGDDTPWLRLTANGGQRSQLLPGHVVSKINGDFVYLLEHDEPRRVDVNRPVTLTDDARHQCWQFVLLNTSVPKGTRVETEPRADWYMRRTACP